MKTMYITSGTKVNTGCGFITVNSKNRFTKKYNVTFSQLDNVGNEITYKKATVTDEYILSMMDSDVINLIYE